MRTIVAAVAAAIIATLFTAVPALADQPYGGCKEAWQAPRSEGAKHCRSHGWLIRPRVVVGPQGWVHHNRLSWCEYEDSSACWWNARIMGNGRGHSFVTVRRGPERNVIRFVRHRSLPKAITSSVEYERP